MSSTSESQQPDLSDHDGESWPFTHFPDPDSDPLIEGQLGALVKESAMSPQV